MNKPQVLALKRPAPSTAQTPIEATQQPIAPSKTKPPIAPAIRAAVPSSPDAQPAPSATAKPKPRPKPPADRQDKEPQVYQAIGVVEAELIIKKTRVILVGVDGDRMRIGGIRDQALLLWLLSNPELWQEKTLRWLVYPNRDGFTLVSALLNPEQDGALKAGFFRIAGHCKTIEPGKIGVLVKRNDRRLKDFTIVTVEGAIEGLQDGEFRSLICKLEGRKLVLLAG